MKLRQFLADVIESVNEQMEELYLYEVHQLILKGLTNDQRTRFNTVIVQIDTDPEIFACELIAKAAGKKMTPPPAYCRSLPDFKGKLAELYRAFLLSHVVETSETLPETGLSIHLTDGTVETFDAQALQRAALWTRLSCDEDFILQLVEAYRPFREIATFEAFRTEFLTTCLLGRLGSVEGAKDVLANFPKRYKAEHYH